MRDSIGETLPTRKKRTEITVQTDRIVVVTKQRPASRAWCKPCRREVLMLAVDEAASLAGVSSRTMYQWVEEQRVHFLETRDGLLLICSDSIPASNVGRL